MPILNMGLLFIILTVVHIWPSRTGKGAFKYPIPTPHLHNTSSKPTSYQPLTYIYRPSYQWTKSHEPPSIRYKKQPGVGLCPLLCQVSVYPCKTQSKPKYVYIDIYIYIYIDRCTYIYIYIYVKKMLAMSIIVGKEASKDDKRGPEKPCDFRKLTKVCGMYH